MAEEPVSGQRNDDWVLRSYEEGSEACRNYSNLTMRVRTVAQQVLLVGAAGLLAAMIGQDLSEIKLLLWSSGVILAVFALSLFFVDWHYQSAFTGIRNYLARMEKEHDLKGPWLAHLDARSHLKDHVANYVPFVLIGDVSALAIILGLELQPGFWIGILALVTIAILAITSYRAKEQDKKLRKRLEELSGRRPTDTA